MSAINKKPRRGVTLIEIMVATVVILVAVIGAIGYRYYSALDARKAKVHVTAARLNSMLLESWKASGGVSGPSAAYDPLDIMIGANITISASKSQGPLVPAGFNEFGKYTVVVDGATYYATLSHKDEAVEDLRLLNVCVGWPQKYPTGPYLTADNYAIGRSVKMTTKVPL